MDQPSRRLATTRHRTQAGEGTRTPNLLITNQLLYQLSYASEGTKVADLPDHLPARPARAVLQDDVLRRELVTDRVGGREVLRGPRVRTLLNLGLDP